MLIKYAQPVDGKRELMCRTDEARVCRIRAPYSPYDGMVERLQTVDDDKLMHPRFFFKRSEFSDVYIATSSLHYHYYKFLSLVAAKSLFPENFCDAKELRVFKRRGKLRTAMYSDFVEDGNGVIERRRRYMREFYRLAKDSMGTADCHKAIMNERERRINPDLAALEEKIGAAGIVIAHPECNYHLSQGSTVFFEIGGINIRESARMAASSADHHAIEAISLLHALEVLRVSRIFLNTDCRDLKPLRKEMLDAGLEGVHRIVNNLIAGGIFKYEVFDPNEFGKWGLRYWRKMVENHGTPASSPDTFGVIDPKAYILLMADLEKELSP
jgi:hypothetical protein